jgi:hypothetical protein
MPGIYGSSGKTANPLGTIGVIVGVIGAVFSVLLWIYRFNPNASLLGSYSIQMGANGTMSSQLGTLALVFGLIAVVLGIAGGLGGRSTASTVASILLGIVALSYPVLNSLHMIERHMPNPVGGLLR